MLNRLAVTPTQYRRVAYATLAALTLIVFTGAAVRLTGSGLGCPNWPKCGGGAPPPLSTHRPLECGKPGGCGLGCPNWPKWGGSARPPLSTHALIEFGNRVVSGLVGVMTVVAAVLA